MSWKKNVSSFLVFVLYGFLYALSANAQNIDQLVLLDEDSNMPIQGATYEYGNQSGISDDKGVITFVITKDEVMRMSHLNYGVWEWDEENLRRLLGQGTYYRMSLSMSLYPVTVIAVKPSVKPGEKINIDYQDRMQHDGAAILSQIPAINGVKKSGSYGLDPVFRGFKYDQLNIIMNGAQSATAACPNRMDPPTSQMAPNMMERVEILKGPYALRYGVGVGGTINFMPPKIRFSDQNDVYGRVSSEYQGNGNVFRSEGQIGLLGKNYNMALFGAWSEGDDYKVGNNQMVQSDFRRGSIGTNLGLKLSSNQELRLSALFNMARDVDFPALPMDLRNDDTWIFSARHDIIISNAKLRSWNTTVYGSFVDHLMNNLLKPLDPRMLNANTAAKTYNYGGRTEGLWHFQNGKLFAGLDLRVEGAEGTRIRQFIMGPNNGKVFNDNAWQNGQISKTGMFGEYHIRTEAFQYIFSGRLEMNEAFIQDPSDEFAKVFPEPSARRLNPGLSAGLVKRLGKDIKAALWIGRAQRSGSLTERFINYFPVGQDAYEMLGNPGLKPELNNQVDLTFEWRSDKSTLNIDLFASYLQDYISSLIDPNLSPRLPMSPGVRRFVNLDRAMKTGFEIDWKQQLNKGLQHQIGVAYTYGQNLDEQDPLPEIAPLDFRYSLFGTYLDGKFRPEVTFRYVLDQSRISTAFGETTTPAFGLLNLQLSYDLSDRVRFGAGINNLLNATYYEHLNRASRGSNNPIFERGRNVFTSINISFD